MQYLVYIIHLRCMHASGKDKPHTEGQFEESVEPLNMTWWPGFGLQPRGSEMQIYNVLWNISSCLKKIVF